jgi:ABC-2 type transport system permease protein
LVNSAVDLLRAQHCEIEALAPTTSTLEEVFVRTVEKRRWKDNGHPGSDPRHVPRSAGAEDLLGIVRLSTLMILFFLFLLRIDIVQGRHRHSVALRQNGHGIPDADRMVRGVYGGIATFLYTFGMFLAVFASAGLIPSVLEPGRIELLLSKPLSRTHILLGRYAGNVLVVSCNIIYLVLGVWIILGVKTGIWSPTFLIAIATTTFIFAVLLAVVVLIGVLFESAALATMVTVALMIISPILAQTSYYDAPAFLRVVAPIFGGALLLAAQSL